MQSLSSIRQKRFPRLYAIVQLIGKKDRSQSLTILHIPEKHGFHYFIRRLGILLKKMGLPMKYDNSLSFGTQQNTQQQTFFKS